MPLQVIVIDPSKRLDLLPPTLLSEISNLAHDMYDIETLKKDIDYLHKVWGIERKAIAAQAGVTESYIRRVLRNKKVAGNIEWILTIRIWAKKQRELQRQPLNSQPHVSVSSKSVPLSQLQ